MDIYIRYMIILLNFGEITIKINYVINIKVHINMIYDTLTMEPLNQACMQIWAF